MNASNPPSVTAVDALVSRSAGDVQMLVFVVRDEKFAVPLTEIQEILTIMPLTPVPHAPLAVRGIVNVRGKVATAIDTATILGFGEAKTSPQYMILATHEKTLYGLLIDTVVGVLRTAPENLRSTTDLVAAKAAAAYMSGALVIPTVKNEGSSQVATSALDDAEIILALSLPAIFGAVTASAPR